MYYFTRNEGKLQYQEVDVFPKELEELYQEIRNKYTITFKQSDWADDDRDAGMGYCYDNSYSFDREPMRQDMIVEDGKLAGFYVGIPHGVALEGNAYSEKYVLKLENGAEVYDGGTYSSFYGNSKYWKLTVEEQPSPAEYVYLLYVKTEEKDSVHVPEDFDGELIESVEKRYTIEDSRGYFDGAYRIKLKLTPEGITAPERVLDVLKSFRPVLVRK